MDKNYKDLSKVFSSGNIISFQELEAVPVFKPIKIASGVRSTRYPSSNLDILYYRVLLLDAEISVHQHNCIEKVWVEKGLIKETISGEIMEAANPQPFLIDPYVTHNFETLTIEPVHLFVEFIRPK